MSEKVLPRPRQVTFAAMLVLTGSLLVLLLAFEQVRTLRSLETRERVEEALAQPGMAGVDLGVEQALDLVRVFAMVAAACSVVAAILAVQLFQRSRSARIGVGLAAVPPFLTGMFTEWGMISAVVLAASVMLWAQPARNWFRGLPPPEPPAALRREQRRPEPRPQSPSTSDGSPQVPVASEPRPYAGYGGPAPAAQLSPRGAVDTAPAPPLAPQRSHQAAPRPGTVTAAAILTWVGTGLSMLAMGLVGVAAATAPDVIWDALQTQPELAEAADFEGPGDLTRSMVLAAVVVGGWSLLAAVLAGLVWARRGWARYVLLLSAGSTAGFCLLGVLGQPVLLVPFGLAVGAAYLLMRPESRAWFA